MRQRRKRKRRPLWRRVSAATRRDYQRRARKAWRTKGKRYGIGPYAVRA